MAVYTTRVAVADADASDRDHGICVPLAAFLLRRLAVPHAEHVAERGGLRRKPTREFDVVTRHADGDYRPGLWRVGRHPNTAVNISTAHFNKRFKIRRFEDSKKGFDISWIRKLKAIITLLLWLPLILTQVGPGMRPQLVALFGHALQRNLDGLILPAPLRDLPGVQKAESELSRQLAKGMVDSLLGLSKSAGDQLGQKDLLLEDLGIQTLDRFWEELARTLEQGGVLERSQELLVAFLEDFKRTSMVKLRTQGGVEDLITELDGLNFNPKDKNSNLQA